MPDGSLGQDDIDRMLAELGADGGKPSGPAQPEASEPQAATEPPPDPPTAAATDAPAGALDQDAIDALIAQTAEVVADKPKTTVKTTSNGGGHLDQHEIDKLLAELDPQSRKQKATGSASGHLDQNDIDRLLTELDVSSAGSVSEVVPATAAVADSRAAKPAPPVPEPVTAVPSTQPDAPAQTAAPKAVDGPLSQADIDKLLSELGAPSTKVGAAKKTETAATDLAPRSTRTIPPAPQPVDAVPSKPSDATQELTAAEIDEIVSRHGDSAPPGSESEAVIAQSDIDALVKQLAQATGSPDAQEVADAIAGKADDIDRLQAEMSPVSPEMTRDAVDVNSILGHTASTASLHAQPARVMSNVTTVSVGDWWAARALLAAAVLMLGVCSGVLIWLTMSVGSLSGELRAAREVEHPAVDGYADKLRLALAKLVEADESERARGVRWMEELKRQHPDRAADVGIALARHFRSRDAWRRAADEYGAALEVAGGVDDPHVLLEYADCLTRLGDSAGAIRQVYTLLASESTWLAERDHDGRSVAGVERNRQAVSDAYLMLGRLLARSRSGNAMATSQGPAHAEPAPQHGGGH